MEIESFEKKSKNTIFQILPDPLPELTASSEAEIVTLHTGGISIKYTSHFPKTFSSHFTDIS